MAFCKYSTEFVASSKTELDNIFINDYLPFAQPQFVVVYVYGLYLAGSNGFDNSLEVFAKTLNMSKEDVIDAFEYWQEQGLVQILHTDPIQVTFIPLKNILTANKLYKPDKYETFNRLANDIFQGKRSLSKHEYQEYYDFLERYHMEQEALLMIMTYCVETKKSAVGYNYILTVAKNWTNEGVLTCKQVEEKLKTFEDKNDVIGEIFSSLGIKRAPYIEERSLLNKWQNDYGYEKDVILYICKSLKKKSSVNFEKLDKILTKYYEMKLMSIMEIESFEKDKKTLFDLAVEINKTIGVYYENLDTVVENYILKWINLGFDSELLLEIALYCFKNSIRTLEGMDKTVAKFYKLGLISLDAFHQYMNGILSEEKEIKEVLLSLGINRNVNFLDRENFKTWKNDWKISDELLSYGVTIAKNKDNPIKYLSRVLADWHEKGIKTIEEAKNTTPLESKTQTKNQNFTGRSYSDTDLHALFQTIDEIDV